MGAGSCNRGWGGGGSLENIAVICWEWGLSNLEVSLVLGLLLGASCMLTRCCTTEMQSP